MTVDLSLLPKNRYIEVRDYEEHLKVIEYCRSLNMHIYKDKASSYPVAVLPGLKYVCSHYTHLEYYTFEDLQGGVDFEL